MGELETPEERARRFGRIDDAVAAIENVLFPVTPSEEAIARRLLGDRDTGHAPEDVAADLLRQALEGREGPR